MKEENLSAPVRAKPFVVVGIPVFNEENTVAKIIIGAQRHAQKVIVCDDGSSDLTCEIAEKLGAELVRHEHNLGYGAAIQSLFKKARALNADILVTIDGDGQHNPNEIPRLIDPIVSGESDVVIGSRFVDLQGSEDMPSYRRFGVRVITFMTNGTQEKRISDAQSGFRAYGFRALDLLKLSEKGMSASVEILRETNKNCLKICEVPISCKYSNGREIENSTQNPLSHGASVIMSIFRLIIEDKPLLFLGIPCILCLIAGTFFGIWMLQTYTVSHQIETNIALASLTFVLIGLFALFTAITLYAITRIAKKNS